MLAALGPCSKAILTEKLFYWSNNQNSKKIEPIRNFDGKLSYLNDY